MWRANAALKTKGQLTKLFTWRMSSLIYLGINNHI